MIDLRPGGGEWVVVGCVYKDQALKPSVLDDGEAGLAQVVVRPNYSSVEDTVVLEDESGRVALAAGRFRVWGGAGGGSATAAAGGAATAESHAAKRRRGQQEAGAPTAGGDEGDNDDSDGSAPVPLAALVAALVTGVVIAVRGRVLETGELAVNDVCVPGLLLLDEGGGAGAAAAAAVPRPPGPAGGVAPAYVLLVSGLGFGSAGNARAGPVALDAALCVQLLAEFVAGMAGGAGDSAAAAHIARVVVAGNVLAPPPFSATAAARSGAASATYIQAGGGAAGPSFADRALSAADQEALSAPMREADAALAALAAAAPLDVMPGEHDPATFTLPQQPMHPCLWPAAARYASFRLVTNPYEAEVAGVRLLGSSGQPVADLARYAGSSAPMTPGDELGLLRGRSSGAAAAAGAAMDVDGGAAAASGSSSAAASAAARASAAALAALPAGGDPLAGGLLSHTDLLVNTLYWRHLAPTCPDTLPAYPFAEADPFAIDPRRLPRLLFAGGAPEFGTRLVGAAGGSVTGAGGGGGGGGVVRVVSVPHFATARTAVLVNLRSPTLEAQPVSFRAA